MKKLLLPILFIWPFVFNYSKGQERNSGYKFRGNASLNGQYNTAPIYKLAGLDYMFKTNGTIRSTPVEYRATLYFGSNDGVFYAVDPASGAEKWHINIGSAINSSPAVFNGTIYFIARNQNLYAADAGTGRITWKYNLGKEISNENYWDYYSSSPAILANRLYTGSGDGNLYAFDLATKKLLWKYNACSRIRTTPALVNELVIFGTKDGAVYAVNKKNGRFTWKYTTAGSSIKFEDFGNDKTSIYCSPAVDDHNVLVGGRDGFLYCLDPATGKEKWKFDHNGSWVLSTAIKDGVGYVGSGSAFFLQAVDLATGKELWRFKTASAVFSSITISGDLLYFADLTGNIYAVNRTTGKQKWCFPVGYRVFSTPVIASGHIYTGADDGNLYALKGASGTGMDTTTARKTVYWEGMKTDTSFFWFLPNVDTWIRDYFAANGYEQLDSVELKKLMVQQINNHELRSVVVFSDNKVPRNITGDNTEHALIRQYLDAGGKVVFLGNNPLAYQTDPANGAFIKMDWKIPAAVFGVRFNKLKEMVGYYGSAPTHEGRLMGIRTLFTTSNAIDAGAVTTVLAKDEFGRATLWIKSYGGRPGTGLMQLSLQRTIVGSDIYPLRAAIEYGISW
ncbi:MAG TPA: PQQ-binding-like beta-propeller repeat protein [Mucilaginibacter sp.]|nr:PQQ-binding-like beta-propeller repeat protein [Mucilaginibacter sp.]